MIDGYVAGYDAWNECHPDNPTNKYTDMESDFKFFIRMLPNYFITCKDEGRQEVWRCRSNTGIEDEERFNLLVKAFQQRWPGRFLEVNHTTCTNHVDFSIHLKSEFAPNTQNT